jgi:hypothetical protein
MSLIAQLKLILPSRGTLVSTTIGGYIHIHVDGLVQLSGEDSHVSYSGIFTKTTSKADNAGHGGNVELHAGKLIVKDGAAVSASTFGAGKGGQLDIKVKGPIRIVDTDSRGEGSFIGVVNSNGQKPSFFNSRFKFFW